MKHLIKLFFVLTAILTFTSCSKDSNSETTNPLNSTALRADSSIKTATLPQTILDYISTNYPDITVKKSEIEDNGNYEVKLNNGAELIFDAEGAFLGVDDDGENNFDDTHLNISELPQILLDFIATNYPNESIDEAELENNDNYEVELENEVILIFEADGNFMGIGKDENNDENGENENNDEDGGDETNIEAAALPQTILDYLSANYSDKTIIEAEVEEDGTYEVTLSNGIEVTFDSNGSFLEAEDGNGDEDEND
ncbi:MAG: PepSY-like domain-containing protein [Gillisia sp.]|nr:PepSY-like domain-containing protein [Gillisia sp.]